MRNYHSGYDSQRCLAPLRFARHDKGERAPLRFARHDNGERAPLCFARHDNPFRSTLAAVLTLLLLFSAALRLPAQSLTFSDLDALLTYADAHGTVAERAAAQSDQARLQMAAAYANTLNLKGNATFSATDNFALPVNFIPAEIFGGPSGTFREVTFGQQFVNVFAITPQLDIVNPSTWARVSSAKTSTVLTATTNAINRRNQQENIAAAYANLASAGEQYAWAMRNIAAADSIVMVVRSRYEAGLTRVQDLNNAEVNRTNLLDFAQQLAARKAQNLLVLRSLIGMGPEDSLNYAPVLQHLATNLSGHASSTLLRRQASLQAQVQRSELRANRFAFLPTLSVVAAFNWQQNSNDGFLNDANWIRSRYVGLRLSVPLPTETRLWSQAEDYRLNLRVMEANARQAALQEEAQNKQLDLDIRRALQAQDNAQSIATLKAENYALTYRNYIEGILPLDQLLTAFTDQTNAAMGRISAQWNLEYQWMKLSLNQAVK